jgi:hypothetical protein
VFDELAAAHVCNGSKAGTSGLRRSGRGRSLFDDNLFPVRPQEIPGGNYCRGLAENCHEISPDGAVRGQDFSNLPCKLPRNRELSGGDEFAADCPHLSRLTVTILEFRNFYSDLLKIDRCSRRVVSPVIPNNRKVPDPSVSLSYLSF